MELAKDVIRALAMILLLGVIALAMVAVATAAIIGGIRLGLMIFN